MSPQLIIITIPKKWKMKKIKNKKDKDWLKLIHQQYRIIIG